MGDWLTADSYSRPTFLGWTGELSSHANGCPGTFPIIAYFLKQLYLRFPIPILDRFLFQALLIVEKSPFLAVSVSFQEYLAYPMTSL